MEFQNLETQKLFMRRLFKVILNQILYQISAFSFALSIIIEPKSIKRSFAMLLSFVLILIFLQYKCINQEDFFLNSKIELLRCKLNRCSKLLYVLRKSSVRYSILDDKYSGNETCAICLNFLERGHLAGFLKCNHLFHQNCIEKWLIIREVCPLCKSLTW